MTLIKLKKAIEKTKNALSELTNAILIFDECKNDKEKGVLEDGVVKRFETLFEYCWKLLKIASEYQGVEAPGPRPAIQSAIRFGWINNAELWTAVLDTRNATVHDYFDATPENYLEIIQQFAKDVENILNELAQIK